MALGLPIHLADATMSRALARASHWFGLVCLVGALVSVTSLSAAHPADGLWPTIIALVPMGILLITLATTATLVATVGYLVIGGLSSFIYTATLLGDPHVFPASNLFVVALPAMALVMVGGVGTRPFVGVAWASAGLVIGEGAIIAACLLTDVPYRLDGFVPTIYLFLSGVLIIEGLGRRRIRATQPAILRAARDNTAFSLRRDLEARATSLVHDTALSHLVTIAASRPGPLDPRFRTTVTRDLERLVGQEWLTGAEASLASLSADWALSPLAEAVEAARGQGLRVEIAGDRRAVSDLPLDVGQALGLAVRACLINVIRHAGVDAAEIAIIGDTPDETSVMVTDAGRGFTPEPGSAGIGLRHSVRQRIEDVGGDVRVWSRPGAGTSVLLTVPRKAARADHDGDFENLDDVREQA
ncbi:ATP-binding protein [Rathayibacter sp. YIM 133350]|uniref:sensor histidine kinase n=1 Tax=Rathayibacter sp. YIM 133350 TaxID=3131992 RepID=UPI00307E9016